MRPPAPVMSMFARQLAHPSGMAGRVVGRMLNRGNAGAISTAIDLSGVGAGHVAADLGFGGGLGLRLLLERTAPEGTVHGVELSSTLLSAATRSLRSQIASGRLYLHEGSLERLPLADGSLDAVITLNTFYFLAELEHACSELVRVLAPGGAVVVGVGDPGAMSKMPFTAHGFVLRSAVDVQSALAAAGLTVQEDHRLGEGQGAYHLITAVRSSSGAIAS